MNAEHSKPRPTDTSIPKRPAVHKTTLDEIIERLPSERQRRVARRRLAWQRAVDAKLESAARRDGVMPIDRLALAWLPTIARQLQYVRGNSRRGFFGPWKVYAVPPEHLRELGAALEQVAKGKNARVVLRQNERTKPTKEREHLAVALILIAARVKHRRARPATAKAAAIQEVRSKLPAFAKRTDGYIERVARDNADKAFQMLKAGTASVPGFGSVVEKIPDPQAVDELRRYLARQSGKRPNNADK